MSRTALAVRAVVDAPPFTPKAGLRVIRHSARVRATDDLAGVVPTWRLGDSPIYDALVAERGVPGRLTGAPLAGVVVPAPILEGLPC